MKKHCVTLFSRHEAYGQQYAGQGPPTGQPPYGGHQPGMYPQQQVRLLY